MSEQDYPLYDALSEAINYLDKKYVDAKFDENNEPFNRFLSVIKPGQLIVLAGDYASEKDSLALNLLTRKGLPAAYFEQDAEPKMIALNLISLIGRIPISRLLSGELLSENYSRLSRAVKRMSRMALFLDTSALTISNIIKKLDEFELQSKKMLSEEYKGFSLVVISGLEGLERNPDSIDEYFNIIAQLKQLAERHDMSIVVVSNWFPQIAVTKKEKIHSIDIGYWRQAFTNIDTLAVACAVRETYPEYPSSKPINLLVHDFKTASQTSFNLRYWPERLSFEG